MAGEIFDPHALLMKLRNPHGSGREIVNYDRRLPPPFPDQIPRPNADDRPDVIVEMEKEIQELSSEVSKLRSLNKQLNNDKKVLETQLAEQKEKSEAVIAKLRNHIATLNKKLNNVKASPPKPTTDRYVSRKAATQSRRKPSNSEYENSIHKSFSGPTFSEMMRRNTPENHGFKESLRKDRISAATQPRPSSHSSHEDYPPLPPPLDDERLSPVSYPQQERGLNRSLSFDRKGANSSLQRAFSFGEAGVGVSEEVEDDDDEDLPVVDIDLRY